MNLFYSKKLSKINHELSIRESNHCLSVLRKNINDNIYITDGEGIIYKTKIKDIKQNQIIICDDLIVSSKEKKKTNIHIAIAPTKNRIRFEWFLEKATEIGIDTISPIFCNNSERKKINQERCEKIIISAMKQSFNSFLPKLNQPISFDNFLKKQKSETYIAHCFNNKNKVDLTSILMKKNKLKNITIMIGPEGDFSEKEILKSEKNGIQGLNLSTNRLRTETAGIVACTIIKTIL